MGEQVAESAEAFFASDDGCPVFEELYDASNTFRRFINDYMTAHANAFPTEHAELLGMATSMNMSASTVFMQNGCSELYLLFGDDVDVTSHPVPINTPPIYAPYLGAPSKHPTATTTKRKEHCSDLGLIFSTPSGARIVQGHNEDWWSTVADKMSVIHTPQWWGYIYPGNFAGTSLVVSSSGLSFTMNSVYPTVPGYHADSAVNHTGVAYLFAYSLRAVLNTTSTSQAIALLSKFPIYSGYSLNIMSACDNTLTNIEGYGNRVNVETRSQAGYLPHFNIYLNTHLPQDVVGTSQERMLCAEKSTFSSPNDVRNFLGNLSCPIFFTASNGLHTSETLSTWILDPVSRSASMYRLPVDCEASLSRCSAYPNPVVYDWEYMCE